MPSLSRLFASVRERLLDSGARPIPQADPERRRFFRRAGVGAAAAVGTGLFMPDDAWAGVEGRANEFGIRPGTVVDAQGRPMAASGLEPYVGEIMMTGWNFATRGWQLCNGQLLPVNQNSALFSLLGTVFGGDGVTTFALPDMRGRFPMQFGAGPGLSLHNLGARGGTEQTTLLTPNLPAHTHMVTPNQPVAAAAGTLRSPGGNVPAADPAGAAIYAPASAANASFGSQPGTTSATGGNLPVSIMPPFLTLNFQIALVGVFPSRT